MPPIIVWQNIVGIDFQFFPDAFRFHFLHERLENFQIVHDVKVFFRH